MSYRPLFLLVLSVAMLVLSASVPALTGCDKVPPNGEGASASATGAGGCSTVPRPLFTVIIVSLSEGRVPPDTSLEVSWSADDEPKFVLNDESTWGTLEDGANVVCDIDRTKPPPSDLERLVCHLWTSGATEIKVLAEGYEPHVETLVPTMSEECNTSVPKEVMVLLMQKLDAGAPP